MAEISALVERSAFLRRQLLEYEGAVLRMAERLGTGVTVTELTDISAGRWQVVEAIEEFHATHQPLWSAWLALGLDEGGTLNEIRHILGVSSEYASRLADGRSGRGQLA